MLTGIKFRMALLQVLSVNGQLVNNLKDLVSIVDSCTDTFLDLDLDYKQKVVLHTHRAKQVG